MEDTRKPARRPRAASSTAAGARPVAGGKASRPKKTTGAGSAGAPAVAREEMVRMAAYFRAERRGFAPGHDLEDWLAAEAEVTTVAAQSPARRPRKAAAKTAPRKTARRKPPAD